MTIPTRRARTQAILRRAYGIIMFAILSHPCVAATNPVSFLEEFVTNYNKQAFEQQAILVKENKAQVPLAFDVLINQATRATLTFEERVVLFTIASKLAYMNLHWHGDESLIKIIDPLIAAELKEQEAKSAELMKWKSEERIIGNFVMKKTYHEMTKSGLPAVLYPHWLHRALYECKVCHDSLFKMNRWENNLSQQVIAGGGQCGTCHNGKTAFSATDKGMCTKCHVVGRPEAAHLHNPSAIDHEWLKNVAKVVGAKWQPENLPNGTLPLDRFGFVDWLALKKRNAFLPVSSLDTLTKTETRSNKIVFKSRSSSVKDVTFDHKIHSDWINCSTCHPALFEPTLENDVKMSSFAEGRFCGHCHGKVSFTFADCLRCHKDFDPAIATDSEVIFRKRQVGEDGQEAGLH